MLRILSDIKGSEASRAITEVSLYARSAEVRKAAVEELKRRDPRDFMGALIETLHRPLNILMTGEDGGTSRNNILVHDNSLPPSMLTPFDAEPLLEALADDSRESTR